MRLPSFIPAEETGKLSIQAQAYSHYFLDHQ